MKFNLMSIVTTTTRMCPLTAIQQLGIHKIATNYRKLFDRCSRLSRLFEVTSSRLALVFTTLFNALSKWKKPPAEAIFTLDLSSRTRFIFFSASWKYGYKGISQDLRILCTTVECLPALNNVRWVYGYGPKLKWRKVTVRRERQPNPVVPCSSEKPESLAS